MVITMSEDETNGDEGKVTQLAAAKPHPAPKRFVIRDRAVRSDGTPQVTGAEQYLSGTARGPGVSSFEDTLRKAVERSLRDGKEPERIVTGLFAHHEQRVASRQLETTSNQGPPGFKPNVLLIEPDPHLRRQLLDMLQGQGYDVTAPDNADISAADIPGITRFSDATAYCLVIFGENQEKETGMARKYDVFLRNRFKVPILFLTDNQELETITAASKRQYPSHYLNAAEPVYNNLQDLSQFSPTSCPPLLACFCRNALEKKTDGDDAPAEFLDTVKQHIQKSARYQRAAIRVSFTPAS